MKNYTREELFAFAAEEPPAPKDDGAPSPGQISRIRHLSMLWGAVGLLFVFLGVRSLLIANNESAPLRISLQEYIRTKPANNWLELTDCTIRFSQVVYHYQVVGGAITDAIAPVYPDDVTDGPVSMVVEVRAEDAERIRTSGASDVSGQTISGMVAINVPLTDVKTDYARKMKWEVAKDCAELIPDAAPSRKGALVGLGIGAFIVIWMGGTLIHLRRIEVRREQQAAALQA